MKLRLLYFAAVRDLVGVDEETIEVPQAVRTVAELSALLERERPVLAGRLSSVRYARNEVFAEESELLQDGDVVAVIPPVAGG